jgi:hypothetical protein
MASQLKKDEIRKYVDQLLSMISDQAESIHLHKKDYEIVKASPASFGLMLKDGGIVKYIGARIITVRAVD